MHPRATTTSGLCVGCSTCTRAQPRCRTTPQTGRCGLPDGTTWPRPRPVVACEDWFAGVNPGTARDIARQFYFAEAAAQRHGLVFRAVANQTWKKTYLGRGNMRSDEALLAYSAAGYAAHPHVERWAGATVGALTQTDDAAALGVAHHWLKTEAT